MRDVQPNRKLDPRPSAPVGSVRSIDRLILLVPALLGVVIVALCLVLTFVAINLETGKNRARKTVEAYSRIALSAHDDLGLVGLVSHLDQVGTKSNGRQSSDVDTPLTIVSLARENGSKVLAIPKDTSFIGALPIGWTNASIAKITGKKGPNHHKVWLIGNKFVLKENYQVFIGQTYTSSFGFVFKQTNTLIGFVIGSLVLIAVTFYWSQFEYMKRVRQLTEALRRVTGGEQGVRVAVERSKWFVWEIDDLSTRVNLTLDRTEATMGAVKDWTAQAAHELRGHLALVAEKINLIGNDQAIWPISENAAKVSAVNAITETLDVFDSLLDLVEIRADVDIDVGPIQMDDIFKQVHTLYGLTADDLGAEIIYTNSGPPLIGEYWLVLRAVSNLVENALKFGPRDGKVHVSWNSIGTKASLIVRDEGQGPAGASFKEMAQGYLPKTSATGHRLGLKTVEAIAVRHGAKIEVIDASPGTSIALIFPKDRLDQTPTLTI